MGDKADWSDGFLRNLFDACKEEIEAGNRPMGISSLLINPVISKQKTIEEQVRYLEE
jgi:hypothetical protein